MKSTAVETVLHIDDFTKYFEAKRLGKLYFPNGQNFYIALADLYKLVTQWRVNHTLVPPDDIVAVIAFGSAVRHPGFREVTKRGLFRGLVTERVPIQPRDADFLVITGKNLTREELLEPSLLYDNYGGAYIIKGGIHIVNRSVNQIIGGVKANDTVSASGLREGVPIFFNGQLDGVVAQTGIVKNTPCKIFWDEDDNGLLTGIIN